MSNHIENLGKYGYNKYKSCKNVLSFIHECNLSLLRFINRKAVFRSKDFWLIYADCSYKAISIVFLVSFLVGLILAFVGALQLRAFGASIYVAGMVAIGMTRIMSAIMVGIIMAGRTGSAFAATIGTMKVNEEIDALITFGIKTSDFLVIPRLVSLMLSIGFLTMLADIFGILGGCVVGVYFLDISFSTYLEYTIKSLSFDNFIVGIIYSLIYGMIISICGCYHGLNASKNADSVGVATTNAMVSSLIVMIITTGILTVITEVLGV